MALKAIYVSDTTKYTVSNPADAALYPLNALVSVYDNTKSPAPDPTKLANAGLTEVTITEAPDGVSKVWDPATKAVIATGKGKPLRIQACQFLVLMTPAEYGLLRTAAGSNVQAAFLLDVIKSPAGMDFNNPPMSTALDLLVTNNVLTAQRLQQIKDALS